LNKNKKESSSDSNRLRQSAGVTAKEKDGFTLSFLYNCLVANQTT
jgi:hypothetical protein